MEGMLNVLTKAISFVLIIVTGYALKKKGFFRPKDFHLVSRMVICITLPCAIVSNFSRLSMDNSLLFMCVLGLAANVFTLLAGFLASLRDSREGKAFNMLNMSGYNVGNFTLPFVQEFLGPMGFAATSLFDTGNAIMCTGITYTLVSMVSGKGESPSVKNVAKSLLSSMPFNAYVVMTVLAVLRISLPEVVVSYAGTVGSANAFLALLMIGIGFELRFERAKISRMVKVLGMRYGLAVLMAVAAYLLLPFPLDVRRAMALVALGPVSSVAAAYTGRLGGDVELASAVNSLSIVLSIVAITAALLILL